MLDLAFLEIPEFDPAVAERHARERLEAAKAICSQKGRFIGTALGAWLPFVRAAGVPCVDAKLAFELPRDVFMRAGGGETDEDQAVWADFNRTLQAIPESSMARWDPCSGIELKAAMGEANSDSLSARRDLHAGDPRAVDILIEYPSDVFPVWERPWVDAMMVEGFPVEFRVYVKNSVVLGVASYYPQRPLPETAEMLSLAAKCSELTSRVLAHLAAVDMAPWMPSYAASGEFDPALVSGTLDFLVTPVGDIVFLEAGPPFGAGAHPCAFIDAPEITGVALAPPQGARLR
jgi:hypothetical protein